jgi:hypothetical protein
VREFEFKYSILRFVNKDNDVGILLLNEFEHKPKYVNLTNDDNADGIDPSRLLSLTFRNTKFIADTPVDNAPSRLLLPNCNFVNDLKAPRLEGIDPVKRLLLKSNNARLVNLPNDDGIDSDILLPPSCKDDNLLSNPKDVGNVPIKPNDEATTDVT